MDGYDILAGFLIFFLFFIYATWFGFSIKSESEKNKQLDIKINPYDNVPLHRRLIDKKNSKVGFFDYKMKPESNIYEFEGIFKGDSIYFKTERKGREDFLLNNRGFHWISKYPFNR